MNLRAWSSAFWSPRLSSVWPLLGLVGIGLLWAPMARGQEKVPPDSMDPWHESAWTPIIEQNGVRISYIFYSAADNEHNGVVLRLDNENQVAVRYSFTLIFRSPEADTSTHVRGTLQPGEMKTGGSSGLFWVPFKQEDYRIGEIGLRGLHLTLLPDPPSSRARAGPPENT